VVGHRIKKRNEDNVKERMQKTLAHENRVRVNQVQIHIAILCAQKRHESFLLIVLLDQSTTGAGSADSQAAHEPAKRIRQSPRRSERNARREAAPGGGGAGGAQLCRAGEVLQSTRN
jgi:hypothetical protein